MTYRYNTDYIAPQFDHLTISSFGTEHRTQKFWPLSELAPSLVRAQSVFLSHRLPGKKASVYAVVTQGPDSDMRTNQIELVRPVERISFRRTENIDVQLSHLLLLGHRSILRVVVVVVLRIGGVGLLGRRLTLLSLRLRLRLCRFGCLLVVRIFYCLTAIVVYKCLAFPFVV
jgi:hypothetical protein